MNEAFFIQSKGKLMDNIKLDAYHKFLKELRVQVK